MSIKYLLTFSHKHSLFYYCTQQILIESSYNRLNGGPPKDKLTFSSLTWEGLCRCDEGSWDEVHDHGLSEWVHISQAKGDRGKLHCNLLVSQKLGDHS